jgi:hypothetical protein
MFVSEANSGAAATATAAVHLLSVTYSKSLLSFPSVVVSLSPAFFTHTTTVLLCAFFTPSCRFCPTSKPG